MKTDVWVLIDHGVQLVTLIASLGGIAYYLMAGAAARRLRKKREQDATVTANPRSLQRTTGSASFATRAWKIISRVFFDKTTRCSKFSSQ